jgi:tRNA pseudouridine55 synthase
MNGILLVNKPTNITSQAVLTKIKHSLHPSKIGHAGTLDPMATGLLVVLLGDATKLSDYVMAHDKTYEARIVLGKATTTEDGTGETVSVKTCIHLEKVDSVLTALVGPLMQTPPMYSSVHHQGKKLYEYARKGIEIERLPREVQIYELKRQSEVFYQNDEAEFSFIATVSKGTYIRTLCVEIGNRLQYPAHMKELRRIRSGGWSIEEAYTLDEILEGKYTLHPLLEALHDLPHYEVTDEEARAVLSGCPFPYPLPGLSQEVKLLALVKNQILLGIYEKIDNMYKARRVWN